MMKKERFIKELNRIRLSRNINRAELSRRAGLDESYVYRLFNGRRNIPKPVTLDKLAKGLGISQEKIYKLAGIKGDDKEPVVEREKKDGHHVFRWQGKEISESDWEIIQGIIERMTKK